MVFVFQGLDFISVSGCIVVVVQRHRRSDTETHT